MKRSRKSNRVTWASGLNLCQVRLFSADDCPSKVGEPDRDHHQNDLPPGFEGPQCFNSGKNASSGLPWIQWKCPPKVPINSNWLVAAGEESQEAELQKFREMRTLEAVYPHSAAIPPSPFVSLDVMEEHHNDSLTPVIPLTPVEDEPANSPSEISVAKSQNPILSETCKAPTLQLPPSTKPELSVLPNLGSDIIGAASAAVETLKKSMDISSIDTELLLKIFSDPKMIEKLLSGNLTVIKPSPASSPKPIPPTPPPAPPCVDQTITKPGSRFTPPVSANKNMHLATIEAQPVLSGASNYPERFSSVSLPRPEIIGKLPQNPDQLQSVSKVAHKPCQVQSVSNMGAWPNLPPSSGLGMAPVKPEPGSGLITNLGTMKPNPAMDINYIKNLIQEHGTEKKANLNSNNASFTNQIPKPGTAQNVESKVVRQKFQKPCMYFQTPRGCRNGSNCLYQHDLAYQFQNRGRLDVQVSKRMKLSGEMTIGRA